MEIDYFKGIKRKIEVKYVDGYDPNYKKKVAKVITQKGVPTISDQKKGVIELNGVKIDVKDIIFVR